MFHIHSNRSLISSLLATTFLFAGAGSAAHAQQTPPPIPSAPVFPNVDENGVDLTTAKFEYAITGVTIGEGDAALDATFRTANGQWRADSFKGYVRASYGSPLITVTLNGDSETFTTTGWPGGTITSNQAEGSTLIYDSWAKLYYYTKTDGTVAVFDVTKYANGIGNGSQVSASLVSLQHPNGKKETIDYRIVVGTAATPAGTLSGTVVSAVDSIKNNYGYQIKYNYPPNGGGPNPSFGLLSVTAINNGKDYCNPSANSCSVTQTAATSSVTQTYVNAAPVITNLTDPLGRLTQFTYNAAGQLTGIKRPGSAGNNVSIVYNGSGNVQSVTNEGIVFQYNYSVNAGVATMTRTNPSGQTLVVVTNQALGRPSSVKDEASRTTTYLYDTNGRVTRMTLPEGNYVQYAYDGRGNVTSSTRVAKSGSGLANIVVSASYPASCTNAKTCNKPTTSTDALGNITDYAYDAGSGFVTSVTAPAPVTGGVRPQTRYTYVSPQAYFKNSSGSIVASGQPITLLQTISQCRSTTSCAGGADETKPASTMVPKLQVRRIICWPDR